MKFCKKYHLFFLVFEHILVAQNQGEKRIKPLLETGLFASYRNDYKGKYTVFSESYFKFSINFSMLMAFFTSKSPILVRRSAERCAPDCKATPKSFANERM